MALELTATGRYYRVYVNGQSVSQHTTEREAIQKCSEVFEEAQNRDEPKPDVVYRHEYEVRAEMSYLQVSSSGTAPSSGNHGFTGLPLTEDGWTDWDTVISGYAAGSRIVYLSAAGNDGTASTYAPGDSATPTNPGAVNAYSTWTNAYAQLRDGFSDVLLIRRGDDFSSTIDVTVSKSGASQSEPQIIGSYGSLATARPTVTNVGIVAFDSGENNVGIFGLHMIAEKIIDFGGYYNIVEDVQFESTTLSGNLLRLINISSKYSSFRRNSYVNKNVYTGWPTNQGMNYSLLEESTWWTDPAFGLTSGTQNLYLNTETLAMTSRWCSSINSPATGWRQRNGGNIIGILVLNQKSTAPFEIGCSTGFVNFQYNLCLNPAGPSGFQTHTMWVNVSNGYFANNLINDGTVSVTTRAEWGETGLNLMEYNIFWNSSGDVNYGGIYVANDSNTDVTGPFTVRYNDFQADVNGKIMSLPVDTAGYVFGPGNRYYSPDVNHDDWFGPYQGGSEADYVPSTGTSIQVNYSAPNRSVSDYMTFLGESPTDESDAIELFAAGSISNRRGAWSDNYTARGFINYRRAGFDLDPETIDYTEPASNFWVSAL